jgi:hypothetical protein
LQRFAQWTIVGIAAKDFYLVDACRSHLVQPRWVEIEYEAGQMTPSAFSLGPKLGCMIDITP